MLRGSAESLCNKGQKGKIEMHYHRWPPHIYIFQSLIPNLMCQFVTWLFDAVHFYQVSLLYLSILTMCLLEVLAKPSSPEVSLCVLDWKTLCVLDWHISDELSLHTSVTCTSCSCSSCFCRTAEITSAKFLLDFVTIPNFLPENTISSLNTQIFDDVLTNWKKQNHKLLCFALNLINSMGFYKYFI